jgi:23S rRNA (pseudouridine1915-N3)-methyltransferase
MKITLLAVGKTSDARLQSLIEEYTQRLRHYVPFEFIIIPDVKNAKSLSQEQLKTAEGNAILSFLTPATDVLLLDEHGREFRSIEYADYLQKKMASGKDLTLIIGGAYGFSKEVYARANGKISLSRMTFSHQMIRLMAIEQIYRAMTILRNEPYHHE